MTASFLAPGGSFATGWTAYAPLSTDVPIGQLFFTIGVQFAGASSIATALNFLVTIITMRAPGMSFWRMPLLVWANFSTSLLVVIATPFVAASQFFVLLDYALGFNFFVPEKGGDVLMYQHVFWFYSHPAVYIMMLPGFGIISEILSVKSRKPIFGYRMMAFSLLAIVLLGFTVWAHHMFVSGMQSWIRIPMMVTTAIIAVPTGIKIFSWLATLWRGVLHLDTPMLFALGFLTMFTLGGISGVMLAMLPVDDPRERHLLHRRPHPLRALRRLAVHDLRRRLLLVPEDDGPDVRRAARQAALLADVRRLQRDVRADAPDRRSRACRGASPTTPSSSRAGTCSSRWRRSCSGSRRWSSSTTWSARGAAAARAEANPWRALTLEWQVSSPPPIFNFDRVPTVVGGPYEYGVPGAVHGIFQPAGEEAEHRQPVAAAGEPEPGGGDDG